MSENLSTVVDTNPQSSYIVNEVIELETEKSSSLRSKVYEHFDWNEDSKKYRCLHCKNYFKRDGSNSTGNLIKHIKRKHKSINIGGSDAEKFNQSSITQYLKPKGFSKDEFEGRLLNFVIMTNQPFTIVESPAFLDFALYGREVNSLFNADTMKRKLVLLYHEEKDALVKTLQEVPGKISLVLDCWTTKHYIGFHGVIVSWISKDWKYEQVLLDLDILKGGHTGKELAKSLIQVLEDFGILKKVLAVTSDNARNCDTMFEEFSRIAEAKGLQFDPQNQRVRCLAHIVNLACKDAISVLKKLHTVEFSPEYSDVEDGASDDNISCSTSDSDEIFSTSSADETTITETPESHDMPLYFRVRKAIQTIRNSGYLRDAFKNACRLKKIKHKQLVLDVEVRWNTTHFMLQRLCDMKTAFEHLVSSEPKLSKYKLDGSDWKLLSEIVAFLEPFLKMTQIVSKEKQPSMAVSAAVYIELYNHLESFTIENGKGADICTAASAACAKLNKYYPSSDGLVYIMGLLLDPRCKTKWYKSVGIPAAVAKRNKKTAFDHWEKFYKNIDGPDNSAEESFDILSSQVKRAKVCSTHDEFKQFLSAPTSNSVDCLLWWKEHESNYPNLARMARDFLAVSGTGVPIERVFSYGTDLLSQKRLSMCGDTIRMCFCLKAWKKMKSEEFKAARMTLIAKAMTGLKK